MSSARSRLRWQHVSAAPRSRKTHAAYGSHFGRRREVLPNQALGNVQEHFVYHLSGLLLLCRKTRFLENFACA